MSIWRHKPPVHDFINFIAGTLVFLLLMLVLLPSVVGAAVYRMIGVLFLITWLLLWRLSR